MAGIGLVSDKEAVITESVRPLAADLPAAVLADLDIHLHTAIRWVKHAQRDWADYIAARAAE